MNFSDSAIEEQLNRILTSPVFKGSRVLSGFLEFVTNKTLAGRVHEIKEYSIGIQVLSKKMDFNPQLDSIVRIHAGRLRRALSEYYHNLGVSDPIRIDIPKGSYIPVFETKKASENAGDFDSDMLDKVLANAALLRQTPSKVNRNIY